MKNVWILNHYAQEPGGAGGTRHYSLAKHLVDYGWKASIIAASVELNTGRQRLSPGEKRRLSKFGNVPFLWVRTPRYKGNGGGRMINMLMYSLRVLLPWTTRKLDRPDVIIGSSVHPFAAAAGAILARRFRVPFVFEVRDLWPQTLVDLGRLQEKSIITGWLLFLEKWLYRRANKIVALLPQAADYIVPLGIPADKIIWIPNGVELDGYPEPSELSKDGTFTLMYFGAHGQANGLDNILKAMSELQNRPDMQNIKLRLIGDGPTKQTLIQLAQKLELNNVEFEDPVPKNKIPSLAEQADAFVFNLIDSPVFNYGVSSNKLFDYLAGARPIIFACKSSNNPVAEANAGITVKPDNPIALANAISDLVNMPIEELSAMGVAARNYVEQHHSFSALSSNFAKMLDEIVT